MAGNDKDMEKYLETLRKQKVEKEASKLSRKTNMTMEEARSLLESKSQEHVKKLRAEKQLSALMESRKNDGPAKAILETKQPEPEVVQKQITESKVPAEIDPVMGRYTEALKNTPSGRKQIFEQDLQNTNATMKDVKNLEMSLRNIQTSLTSLGGGGLGEPDVVRLIKANSTDLSDSDLDYIASQIDDEFTDSAEVILLINEHVPLIVDSAYVNALIEATDLDSSDLWALEAAIVSYIDSSLDARFDSAIIGDVYTTDDITEASNLYYTDARADSAVGAGFAKKTTSDLAEGSNLYYTQSRFDSAFAGKDLGTAYDSSQVQDQIDSAIAANAFDISTKTTTDLAEGSNLYYTKARFDSEFGQKTTSNLTEGANLYYTDARVDANFATKTTDDLSQGTVNKYYDSSLFNANFAAKSTDDLGEGSNNLYYTSARVTSLVDSAYVQERVTLEAGVHFKGVVNFATDSAPVNPDAGDMYVSDSDAVANASWSGIAGDLIEAQHGVIWASADSSWHEVGSTSVDASVYVEKSGDTMTGTLTLESGSILVEEGDVTLDNGNITLGDINAKVFTNNVENASASEYVKIHKDGNLKAAFKELEIVSYQPHTYPNNIAADVSATGTNQTLIHKGYVDSHVNTRLALEGGVMTGPINWDEGGNDAIDILRSRDSGGLPVFSIRESGAVHWADNSNANPSVYWKDTKHFELSEMSNGTPQTNFESWIHMPNTGIMFGPGYATQLRDGNLYMTGSSSKLELTQNAYMEVHRIRPAPDKFGDGLSLEGKTNIGGFIGMGFGMVVEDDQVTVNAPISMNSNKITGLADPTSSNDAANKKYVDDNAGGVTLSSGTPSGATAGDMWYDTSIGSLFVKVS